MNRPLAARRHLYAQMLRAAVAQTIAQETDPAREPLPGVGGPRRDDGFAVRVAPWPEVQVCPCCHLAFASGGPTGFFGKLPICDACLLERAPQLGMVLVLVAVVRAFGSKVTPGKPGAHGTLLELAAFARIYEQFARQHAPARSLESFLREPSDES